MRRISWLTALIVTAATGLPASVTADPSVLEMDVTAEPLPHTGFVVRAEIANSSRSDICIAGVSADIKFPDGEEAGFYFHWSGDLIDAKMSALDADTKWPVLLLRRGGRVEVESLYRLELPDLKFYGLMNNPEEQADALAAATRAIEADRYIVTPKLNFARCVADASANSGKLVSGDLIQLVSGRREASLEPIEVTGIGKPR